MRKFILIPLLIIAMLLTSCGGGRGAVEITEGDTAEAKLEEVMHALKTKDRDAAKKLFSKQALADTEDIENGIDYLFSLVQGEVTEVGDLTWGSDEQIRYGVKERKIFSWCDFSTARQDYYLFMLIYDRDDKNPDNIGLYSLRVVAHDGNYAKHVTAWQDMQQPGIYALGDQEVIRAAVNETDYYCRAFIEDCPIPVTRLRPFNNYVKISGSIWTELPYASVLSSGGVLFAVVDLGIYPEYAQGGTAAIDGREIVIVNHKDETYAQKYALLYEPDQKPPEEIIDLFAQRGFIDTDITSTNRGDLQSVIFRYGSDNVTEYELTTLGLIGENSERKALLYVRKNDVLLDGYPIEVRDGRLLSFDMLAKENDLSAWEGDYNSQEMVADGDGYYLSMQYENDYLFSSGYMAFPEGYEQGSKAIIDFFETLAGQGPDTSFAQDSGEKTAE